MKNTLLYLGIACLLYNLVINCGPSGNVNNQNRLSYTNYITSDLDGDWTLIKVEVIKEKQSIERFKQDGGETIEEWSPPVFLNNDGILWPTNHDFFSISNKDLHISSDTIFWLDYPVELKQKVGFNINSDILNIDENKDERKIHMSENKDTLSMSFMVNYGLYIKETYQRVSFNDSLLDILKKYKTNLPLLAGTWMIFKEGNINNDGTEYKLNFPYKIPDSVQITKDELTGILLRGETYQMTTNGKKRNYSLKYDVGILKGGMVLSPSNWLPQNSEGDTQIHLYRLNIERQQQSPQECWNEFLEVITSGNIYNTINLMTDDGYDDLRKNVNPLDLEITLKRRGWEWKKWEITWNEISKSNANALLGKNGKQKHIQFVKLNGLWKMDALTDVQ